MQIPSDIYIRAARMHILIKWCPKPHRRNATEVHANNSVLEKLCVWTVQKCPVLRVHGRACYE